MISPSDIPIQCEEVYPSLPYPEEEELDREFTRHPEDHWEVLRDRVIGTVYVPFTEAQWEAIRNS